MSHATPRGSAGLVLIGMLALVLVAILTGLGVWQIQRLQWKQDLIARVEAGLSAPEASAPGPDTWPALTSETDEYRRVTVSGSYDLQAEALVRAVSAYGTGYWVMTPLRSDEGWTVWINRGFVPQDRRAQADRTLPTGPHRVAGLLRLSQPGGAFLRSNDPAGDRWYSRDTAALAEARGLDRVAPYFIDAGPSEPDVLPIGGLTVVSFRNNHLGYALTWFAMAIGLGLASTILLRRDWLRKRG